MVQRRGGRQGKAACVRAVHPEFACVAPCRARAHVCVRAPRLCALRVRRFLELLKRQGADGLVLVREAVNVPSIMYEIKRITKA